MRDISDLGKHPMNWRRWFSVLGEFPVNADRTHEIRTLFHAFIICYAGLFLFVTVNRPERKPPALDLAHDPNPRCHAAAVLNHGPANRSLQLMHDRVLNKFVSVGACH
jgi:hypothetical protein